MVGTHPGPPSVGLAPTSLPKIPSTLYSHTLQHSAPTLQAPQASPAAPRTTRRRGVRSTGLLHHGVALHPPRVRAVSCHCQAPPLVPLARWLTVVLMNPEAP